MVVPISTPSLKTRYPATLVLSREPAHLRLIRLLVTAAATRFVGLVGASVSAVITGVDGSFCISGGTYVSLTYTPHPMKRIMTNAALRNIFINSSVVS